MSGNRQKSQGQHLRRHQPATPSARLHLPRAVCPTIAGYPRYTLKSLENCFSPWSHHQTTKSSEVSKRLVAEATTPTLGIEENIVSILPRPGMPDDVADVVMEIARNAPQYAFMLLRSLAEAPQSVLEKHKQDLLDLSNQPTLNAATKAEINRALGRLQK
ncbi:MAG: hypothetical protein N2111_14035 [Candidatus Sumerlaeaceae bacterium]|nr:hypothetical protein [Candidatus Sumerlaeaceae bacterium]